MQIDDVKSALSGPVASVYATFHEDGTLAPPSLRQPVRRRYGAGEGFFYGHRRQVIIVQRLKIESIAAYFVIRILISTVGTRQPKDLVIIDGGSLMDIGTGEYRLKQLSSGIPR